MQPFLNHLKAGLQTCQLRDARLLLAVSAGADSTALLHGASRLRRSLNLTLHAAHVNHQLRSDADCDADWAVQLAETASVPITVHTCDARSRATERRQSLEEAARQARYELLQQAAAEQSCTAIVVAHHADDQSETILHHIVRGTGLRGLSGMQPVRNLTPQLRLARPMLEISRVEILQFLHAIDCRYREDASNADPAFTRNRIRTQLLPSLREQFNPQIDIALRRLGRQAHDAQQVITELARHTLAAATLDENDEICRLSRTVLRAQAPHVVRECFHELWQRRNWPRQRMGFQEWSQLAELVERNDRLTLPAGVRAESRQDIIALHRPGET